MLKRLGFWDSEKSKGKLLGSEGNRVKAMKLRGIVSQGILFPVEKGCEYVNSPDFYMLKNIPIVPILYDGPFNMEKLKEVRDGKTTIFETTKLGMKPHIREGIVIKPYIEKEIHYLGRLILKMVSPDYLTRSGNHTEYN